MLFAITLLFQGCFEPKQEIMMPKNEIKNCSNSAFIEQTEICIPNLKGFTNIYENDVADTRFSHIISLLSSQKNEILAFYVENQGDDYSALYVNKTVKRDISNSEYKIMAETMGNYLKHIDFMEDVTEKIDNLLDDVAFPDIPVVIKQYSLNENVVTYFILEKTNNPDNEDIITLTSLNLIHIKSKMVLFNYVVNYIDHNTINTLSQKNDYVISRLLNENE